MAARKKSSAKSRHGGRRAGAGRKSSAVKRLRSDIVAEADRLIGDAMPALIANMLRLANGGYKRVEEKWAPAEVERREDDDPGLGGEPPLVLVEQRVSVAEPDRGANQYLIDRFLGRPKQSVEVTAPPAETPRILIPAADERSEPLDPG